MRRATAARSRKRTSSAFSGNWAWIAAVYIQYGDWLWKILQGDFGDSVWYGTPVLDDLKDRFFITLELAVLAIVLAFIAAVPLGVLSAVKQDSFLDHISRLLALVGIALPTFWLGILVIYGLTYFAGWLPPLGYATLWGDPFTNLQQLIFPALVLAFHDMAFTARVARSAHAGSDAGRLHENRPFQGA